MAAAASEWRTDDVAWGERFACCREAICEAVMEPARRLAAEVVTARPDLAAQA
jgi:hypothetical protein